MRVSCLHTSAIERRALVGKGRGSYTRGVSALLSVQASGRHTWGCLALEGGSRMQVKVQCGSQGEGVDHLSSPKDISSHMGHLGLGSRTCDMGINLEAG